MDAPLDLQGVDLQLDARQFNYRVVHKLKLILKECGSIRQEVIETYKNEKMQKRLWKEGSFEQGI